MLIDEWIATTEVEVKHPEQIWIEEKSPFERDERLGQAQSTLDAMKRSQGFVLSPLVLETACGLGVDRLAVERSAGHFFLPASTTWIDMTAGHVAGGIEGARQGVLLVGDDNSIMSGQGLFVAFVRRLPAHLHGAPDYGAGGFAQLGFRFDLTVGNIGKPAHQHQTDQFEKFGGDLRSVMATIWSAIALINTRRITEARDADLSKINKARHKSGRPPILHYKIVTINIDRETVSPSRGAITGETPLHHVRAFLRIRRGKVELVRPHWRGNPRFGAIVHRYAVMREEDEAGPWRGGPLPPPKIIKEAS